MNQTNQTVDVANLIENRKIGSFQFLVIACACAIMFIEGYDMQVVPFAAPAMIKAWHVNKAYFGPVFGFGLFGYMLGATLLSSLGDTFGRKKIIVMGGLLFGAFTLGAAFSSGLRELLVLRFIAGIGLGASIPSAIALAAEYAPSRRRATTISVLFVGYNLGSTAGGLIAAKFIPTFGWPIVFYVGGIAPILLSLSLIFVLPESVRFLALKEGRREQVAAIINKLAPERSFDAGTQFVLREENRAGVPVKNLFTEGRAFMTLMLWLAFVSSLLGHTFLTSWLPTVLSGEGMSLSRAVVSGALLQFGGAIGSVLIGWLLDKRGIITIAAAFALSAPLIIFIGSAHISDAVLMTAVFLTGIGMLGGQVGLNAISGSIYPTYIRSTGAGWAFGVGRVGSILGPVIGGVLIGWGQPASLLFIYAAIPFLCCAGATYLLGRTPEAHPVEGVPIDSSGQRVGSVSSPLQS
jgi:AAHS family 4-hydroxybenzoate transporter-like MFS transporter